MTLTTGQAVVTSKGRVHSLSFPSDDKAGAGCAGEQKKPAPKRPVAATPLH